MPHVPQDCRVVVDAELGVMLPTALRNHFLTLEVLSKWDPSVGLHPAASLWAAKAKASRQK